MPLVCHVPVGSSVSAFFSDVQIGPDQPGHGVLDVPGSFSCFLRGEVFSCHSPLPTDATVVVLVPTVVATLPTAPSTAGTGDTDALHVAREAADRTAAALHSTGLHTCLDEQLGPRFRGRLKHWLPVNCCLDCELTAYQIPYPVGRLLVYPLEGLPQPQTVVTDRPLLPTHPSILLHLRPVGMHVLVVELVHGAMLHQIYGALPADVRTRVQALFAGRLGHRFFANGKLTNVALPLPPDTDVICIFPPAGGEAAEEVDMASAIWDENPSSNHLSTAAGLHAASTTSTTSTTTAMPTDGAFLSSDDDGLVPASERHQRKGEMQRRVADRAQRARSAGMSNAPYTLFDEAVGARILQRLPHWSRRQCVFHAMAAARVAEAACRLLEHPVPGWPEPQVVVSNGRLWRSHRAVVHLVNGEEMAPSVSQVPKRASIARLHGLTGRFAPTSCWVHDFQYDCMDPVPADTDYIRVHEADSDVFLARLPGLDTPEAVPRHHFLQPAYPSHFRARGYIPHHGFPTATREAHFVVPRPPTPPVPRDGSASSSTASLDDGSSSCSGHVVEHSMTFTVFDVHHHVRVASVALPATRQTLLQAVLEATPQLRPALGHRVLREPLAGFPQPQIVMWQEPLAAEKVIPVMHSEVPQAVCTVSMPTSGTTYQLSYVVEQACDTPPPCRWAVAKEQAHFTLDGASFPPHCLQLWSCGFCCVCLRTTFDLSTLCSTMGTSAP